MPDNRAGAIPAGAFRVFINEMRSLRQQVADFRLRALSLRLRRPRNAVSESGLEFVSAGEEPAAEEEEGEEGEEEAAEELRALRG